MPGQRCHVSGIGSYLDLSVSPCVLDCRAKSIFTLVVGSEQQDNGQKHRPDVELRDHPA